jgi:hypothetical protein
LVNNIFARSSKITVSCLVNKILIQRAFKGFGSERVKFKTNSNSGITHSEIHLLHQMESK